MQKTRKLDSKSIKIKQIKKIKQTDSQKFGEQLHNQTVNHIDIKTFKNLTLL